VATIANTDMAAAWDGEEGDRWAANADHYERAGWRIWRRFEASVPIAPDAAVLDIGCGTGKSTRTVAQLASDGSAQGIDLSAQMLALARERARSEGVSNATFEQADAQVHPFDDGSFDLAISSFGCMFFADPVAAYANIGRALRPGGRLALLAWRDVAANEWAQQVRGALALGRDLPAPPAGAPGPFGFADADHVRRVLGDAGFSDVQLTEIDEPMEFGRNAAEAFSFVRTMGVVKGMTQDLDEATRERGLTALRDILVAHESKDGVLLGTAAWLITAAR
jgi:SAM-dependent methyltransferase